MRTWSGFVAVALVLAGCGDDLPVTPACPACVSAPEAAPADDGKPSGIYKGVVASANGISGTVRADVATDLATGSAELRVGGTRYAAAGFEKDPADATFAARFHFEGDGFVLVLAVDAGGAVVSAQAAFRGIPVEIVIAKETSSALVQGYEGTFGGDQVGIWNFVMIDEEMRGVYVVAGGDHDEFDGTATLSAVFYKNDQGLTGTGDFTSVDTQGRPDRLEGEWHIGAQQGTWEGQRSL